MSYDDRLPLLATPEESSESQEEQRLPLPLRFLFGLNGFTLAFPMQALLYILNDKVQLSVELIPVYAIVAYLPFSLRPLYACWTGGSLRRDVWICFLLICCAVSTAASALVTSTSLFIIMGFLRGLATSWPEFLLGLTLVDQASSASNWESTAALFQSQAATSRNIGCLLAGIGGALILCNGRWSPATTSTILLVIGGAANLLGALVAAVYRVGVTTEFSQESDRPFVSRNTSYHSCSTDEEISVAGDDLAASYNEDENHPPSDTNNRTGAVLIIQCLIVLMGIQSLFRGSWHLLWGFLMSAVLSSVPSQLSWRSFIAKPHHMAGLFLFLSSVFPTAGLLLSSYVYTIWEDEPAGLQIVYILQHGVVCLASWSYGKWWSRFSSGNSFLWLITGATILGSLVSLSNLGLFNDPPKWRVAGIQIITCFIQEWAFLPKIVLATIHSDDVGNTSETNRSQARSLRYGILVSCLETGNQVSALLSGPLIAFLGVSRENNWENLDTFIIVCSFLGILSVGLLVLLR